MFRAFFVATCLCFSAFANPIEKNPIEKLEERVSVLEKQMADLDRPSYAKAFYECSDSVPMIEDLQKVSAAKVALEYGARAQASRDAYYHLEMSLASSRGVVSRASWVQSNVGHISVGWYSNFDDLEKSQCESILRQLRDKRTMITDFTEIGVCQGHTFVKLVLTPRPSIDKVQEDEFPTAEKCTEHAILFNSK